MCYQSNTGEFHWGGACNNSDSDMRLKTDVEPLTDGEGLAAVMKLRPVHFNWKDTKLNKSDGPQIGLIAQEVKEVLPQMVTESGISVTVNLGGSRTEVVNDVLGLKYHQFIFPMIRAIQDLKHLFDGDHAQLQALKAANDNLASETAALKAQLKAANDNVEELRNELGDLKNGVGFKRTGPR
jgi:hypothetical protein